MGRGGSDERNGTKDIQILPPPTLHRFLNNALDFLFLQCIRHLTHVQIDWGMYSLAYGQTCGSAMCLAEQSVEREELIELITKWNQKPYHFKNLLTIMWDADWNMKSISFHWIHFNFGESTKLETMSSIFSPLQGPMAKCCCQQSLSY